MNTHNGGSFDTTHLVSDTFCADVVVEVLHARNNQNKPEIYIKENKMQSLI